MIVDSKTNFMVHKVRLCKDGYWAFCVNLQKREFWLIYMGDMYNPCPNWGPFQDLESGYRAFKNLE